MRIISTCAVQSVKHTSSSTHKTAIRYEIKNFLTLDMTADSFLTIHLVASIGVDDTRCLTGVTTTQNNYMEGSGSATIKILFNNVAHPKYPEEEETSPNRNHIITGKQQQTN